MIAALLYLQFHSIKNRFLMRIKRLRQPKYLVGAIAGGIYFYFYFFRYVFGIRGGRRAFVTAASPENLALFESLGALIFLVVILIGWILPNERAALSFTEAEVAFLFPAPVSRRGLIHFKLLRSQFAILFTTLLLTLITNRFGGHPWIRAAGWWIILAHHHTFLWPAFGMVVALAGWRLVVGSRASHGAFKVYLTASVLTGGLMAAAGYWGGELLLNG